MIIVFGIAIQGFITGAITQERGIGTALRAIQGLSFRTDSRAVRWTGSGALIAVTGSITAEGAVAFIPEQSVATKAWITGSIPPGCEVYAGPAAARYFSLAAAAGRAVYRTRFRGLRAFAASITTLCLAIPAIPFSLRAVHLRVAGSVSFQGFRNAFFVTIAGFRRLTAGLGAIDGAAFFRFVALADCVSAAFAVAAVESRFGAFKDFVAISVTHNPIGLAFIVAVFALALRAAVALIQAKLFAVEGRVTDTVPERALQAAKVDAAFDFTCETACTIFRAGFRALIS